MKSLAAYSLLFLYLVALLRPVQPLIEYYLRYELFAKKLCLNLDRPEMRCNGQCILMQRLKAVNEESGFPALPATTTVNWKDYPVALIYIQNYSNSLLELKRQLIASQNNILHQEIVKDIFHPPS